MITEREKLFLTHWKIKRESGKWNFAFKIGVLLWAIPSFLLFQVFQYFVQTNYELETGKIVTGLIIWMVMGFFGFGLFMWWLNERAYQKLKTKNPEA